MTTATIEATQVEQAHIKALAAAQTAAKAFADKHMNGGDGGACGFSWVDVYGVRSNSKLGQALKAVGFSKSYTGSMQLWNKWWHGQSVDAGEHGATAYATVLKQELGLDRCYSGSRLD
jgi:hypothetical protein